MCPSPIDATSALAVIGPMPGTIASLRLRSLLRCHACDKPGNARVDVADSLRHGEVELAKQPADLVRLGSARPHKSLPDPMQGKHPLLLEVLYRDEAHVRSTHRFADGLRISRIEDGANAFLLGLT